MTIDLNSIVSDLVAAYELRTIVVAHGSFPSPAYQAEPILGIAEEVGYIEETMAKFPIAVRVDQWPSVWNDNTDEGYISLETMEWLAETMPGRFGIEEFNFTYSGLGYVFFKNEADAVLFKLRWSDADPEADA